MTELSQADLIFLIAPSYCWGSDDYELIFYKLCHRFPHPFNGVVEARDHPDWLSRCSQVMLMIGEGSTIPRSTWNTVKSARRLRKPIEVVSLTADRKLEIVPYATYHAKADDSADDAHYVTFKNRSEPRPSSLSAARSLIV